MADVTKNILFTVGTVGAGSAAKKMGMLAAKIGIAVTAAAALGKAFFDLSEQSANFMRTVKEVNIPLERFNEQTKGLIDTTKTYQAAAKLQEAQVKITGDQFAALGAAATKMSQAVGDPDGATARFERLTKAIITGRETALKEFGIDVSQTSDLIAFQAEALQKLTAEYSDFEAQLVTTGEKLIALKNTLGTITDFEMDSFKKQWSAITVNLAGGAEVMTQWETDLVATKGEMNNFFSILTTGDEILMAHNDAMWEGVDVAQVALEGSGKLIRSQREQAAAYRLIYNDLRRVVVLEETRARIAMQAASGTRGAAGKIAGAARTSGATFAKRAAAGFDAATRGGGGGRIGGGGDLTAAEGSALSFERGDPLAAGEDISLFQFELNATEIDGMKQHNAQKAELYKQDAEEYKASQEEKLGVASSAFGNMGKIVGAAGEQSFNAQKALMAAETTTTGIAAAMKGYNQVVGMVPPPAGPILAAAYAATIGGVYAAKVKEIMSQKIGSKGGGAKSAAVSSANFSGGSLGQSQGNGGANITNNIIVEGQTIHSGMIRANERAAQNGEQHFTTEAG